MPLPHLNFSNRASGNIATMNLHFDSQLLLCHIPFFANVSDILSELFFINYIHIVIFKVALK